MTEPDWKWKIGVLHGLGERAFQMLGEKIRHVTQIIPQPNGGIVFIRSMIAYLSGDNHIQHDAGGLVLLDVNVPGGMCEELDRTWNDSKILTGNGAPRLKLT